MPELPEVETVKRGLNKLIIGKKVIAETHDYEVNFPNKKELVEQFLIGARVKLARRKGKLLIIDFDSDYSLMIHLRMTGQVIFVLDEASNRLNLPQKATRLTITFDDKSRLFFNDQRRFGSAVLIKTDEVERTKFVSSLGLEPFSSEFNAEYLKEVFKNRKSAIKAVILNQKIIAGIGNIYADECLFVAGIHPERVANSLTADELKHLTETIPKILHKSIELGGSTSRDYLNAVGQKGDYLDQAYVYKREGEPCLSCGTKIKKIRVGGRGTHYCPHCQL